MVDRYRGIKLRKERKKKISFIPNIMIEPSERGRGRAQRRPGGRANRRQTRAKERKVSDIWRRRVGVWPKLGSELHDRDTKKGLQNNWLSFGCGMRSIPDNVIPVFSERWTPTLNHTNGKDFSKHSHFNLVRAKPVEVDKKWLFVRNASDFNSCLDVTIYDMDKLVLLDT